MRSALQEALARKGPVTRDDVRLRISGQSRSVTVVVEPINDARNADEWLCVIVFQPALSRRGRQAGDSPAEEADGAQSYPGSSRRTQRELRLNNGIDIEVRAADYRRPPRLKWQAPRQRHGQCLGPLGEPHALK